MSERTMLITGASSGIGAATARRAAERGWRLVLSGRDAGRLAGLGEELAGVELLTVVADVSRWGDVEQLAAAARDRFGAVDVVFANAGLPLDAGYAEGDPERWRQVVDTNILGVAHLLKATRADLVAAQGHFVITGSAAGRRALAGSLYSASKWAVSAMAENIRLDLNGTGVRTTVVQPGQVETPFYPSTSPGMRLEPDDVARAVLYAVCEPPHVDVNEIVIRPTAQEA